MVHLSNESLKRFQDNPELFQNDEFFQTFWRQRSQELNEKLIEQERINNMPIRARYNKSC